MLGSHQGRACEDKAAMDPKPVAGEPVSSTTSSESTHDVSFRRRQSFVLFLIVISQFGGTSLWFAGNAILPALGDELDLPDSALGQVTSSVQLGFIVGTLIFASLAIADRFSPTFVFMVCAVTAALLNVALVFVAKDLAGLLILRGLTGVCLAGIYPVGMKVASDWFQDGLGTALGFLVGALVLGTAFPFILNESNQDWEVMLLETAALAILSGLVMGLLVPDGPHLKKGAEFRLDGVWSMFSANRAFRFAAFGYFGHMWELYAFWAFVPLVWDDLIKERNDLTWSSDAIAFVIIAIGSVGCVLGGFASGRCGSKVVAGVTLAISGVACVLSPLAYSMPGWISLTFYMIWGLAVVADSPQFSSLVAQSAPADKKGSALTIVNCIGFAITIGSIQLLSGLEGVISPRFLFLFLAPGPLVGVLSLIQRSNDESKGSTTSPALTDVE